MMRWKKHKVPDVIAAESTDMKGLVAYINGTKPMDLVAETKHIVDTCLAPSMGEVFRVVEYWEWDGMTHIWDEYFDNHIWCPPGVVSITDDGSLTMERGIL